MTKPKAATPEAKPRVTRMVAVQALQDDFMQSLVPAGHVFDYHDTDADTLPSEEVMVPAEEGAELGEPTLTAAEERDLKRPPQYTTAGYTLPQRVGRT